MTDAELWEMARICARKHARSDHFEDLRQELALAGWQARMRFDASKGMQLRVYVWQRMEFAALDYWRDALWRKRSKGSPIRRSVPLSLDELANVWELAPTVEEEGYAAVERAEEVRTVLAYLSRHMGRTRYELLKRHYIDGVTQQQIADEEGVTFSRISQRIKAARKEARSVMGLSDT